MWYSYGTATYLFIKALFYYIRGQRQSNERLLRNIIEN